MMRFKHFPFYLIVLALFLGIISPAMFSDGMFLDGVTYAAISKNLAHGLGSFWDLHYTKTLYPHFHEHPPLAMGLQSLLFRGFGDSLLIERFYSLATFMITGLILAVTWVRVADKATSSLAWLPLLFWVTIPLVTWAAPNNILENTLMIFTGLSVFFILESQVRNRFLFLSLAGIMLFLGFLTKGFVALFPLTLPAWIWIFRTGGTLKRSFLDTSVLTAALVIPFLLMFLVMPESRDSLITYLNIQVLGSLREVRNVDTRLFILGRLILELLPGTVLVLIMVLSTRKQRNVQLLQRWFYLFVALGLSGVLPIMISLKQRGFYILAAFPYFALALALLTAPRVKILLDKMDVRTRGFGLFRFTGILLLAVSLTLITLQYNRVGRDRELIGDITLLKEVIPEGATIAVPSELCENWSLHAYLQRYATISLDCHRPFNSSYLLVPAGFDQAIPPMYIRHGVTLHGYVLYVK
jgi:hypothetical protein